MPNLQQIATTQERALLREFVRTIQSIKDQAVIQEIARLLEVGNVDGVLGLLQLDEATFQPIEEAIRAAYRTGGLTGAEQVGPIPTETGTLVMRFNMRSPAAGAWLADLSSRLIVEIVEQQREMVRERLVDNLARGVNPRQSALDLVGRIDPQTRQRTGGFIGLTTRQAQWVSDARQELENLDPNYLTRQLRDKRLDSAFRKAVESGKPLAAKQIDTAVSRMQARTLRYRAQVISRTESINALRAGQFESMQQAIALGEVESRDVSKTWDATGDARTRLDHLQMEQQYADGIPFEQAFVAPDLSRLMFPGDSSLGASGAQTIQCFIPETPIAVSRLKSAIRREYSGQVVKLCAGSGVNLTVTPNHPILTARGWVPAGEVVKGDKVIDCGLAGKLSGVKPDVADGVTTAEELYNSAQSLGNVDRISRVVVNFHGEIPAKDVDVVSVNSGLSDTFDSTVAKFCDHFTLAETDVSLVVLVFDRIYDAATVGGTGSSSRRMGGRGSSSALIWGRKSCASDVALADRQRLYAKVVKAFIDHVSSYAKLFGYPVNSASGVKESLNRSVERLSDLGSPCRSLATTVLAIVDRLNAKVRETAIHYARGYSKLFGNSDNWLVSHSHDASMELLPVFGPVVELPSAFVDSFGDESIPDNARSESGHFGNGLDSLSSLVEGFNFVEIDAVDFYHYDGPVYNFETESGLIVSGNTISHNCRCKAVYRIDFIGRAIRVEGFR